ncbi:hypothetical protein ANANG_G00085470, partial [Anguilla anguilla]
LKYISRKPIRFASPVRFSWYSLKSRGDGEGPCLLLLLSAKWRLAVRPQNLGTSPCLDSQSISVLQVLLRFVFASIVFRPFFSSSPRKGLKRELTFSSARCFIITPRTANSPGPTWRKRGSFH